MTAATACFLIGFYFRQRDLRTHRVLMSAGVAITVAAAVALIVTVHFLYGGDREAAGFLPAAEPWVILTHRLVAGVTFLTMFVMAWSGATSRRRIHVATARFFLPAFLFVYLSGLFIFTN